MTALFSNALAWVDWENKSITKKLLSWNLESLNEHVLCMPIKIRAYVHLVLLMCIYLNMPAEHGVRSHISMEKWTHIYANIPMNTFITKITYTHMRTHTFSVFVIFFFFVTFDLLICTSHAAFLCIRWKIIDGALPTSHTALGLYWGSWCLASLHWQIIFQSRVTVKNWWVMTTQVRSQDAPSLSRMPNEGNSLKRWETDKLHLGLIRKKFLFHGSSYTILTTVSLVRL